VLDTFLNNERRRIFQVRVNVASWSSMGGWKENAHVFNLDRTCSLSEMVPEAWKQLLLNIFGEIVECPFESVSPPGDTFSVFESSNSVINLEYTFLLIMTIHMKPRGFN